MKISRREDWRRCVVATWSGGIDSTGVVAHLLHAGYHVRAVSLLFGGERYRQRERAARVGLRPRLDALAREHGGSFEHVEKDASWLSAFAVGSEIPRRNKLIIEHLIATEMVPRGIVNLGMGEYVGVDTWLVRDHVAGADCDHRSLTAWIWYEFGSNYRLITLQDFGESRYKCDRLRLGIQVLGVDGMTLTTNCLRDSSLHCGACYKCVERHAAWLALGYEDATEYDVSPEQDSEVLGAYLAQFEAEDVSLSFRRWK